jgi:hypothetical protein
MLKRLYAILICLTTLCAFANWSAAAIVDLTWTGVTAFGGNDGLGLFGPASPMPADTPYVATFRFDTTISFFENGTNGSQEVTGGTFYDPDRAAPLLSSSITINGMTVAMNGDYSSSYYRQSGQGASQVSALAQRELNNPQPYGGELFQRVFRAGNFYGMPLDQPGEFDFDVDDNPGGNFSYFNRDANGDLSGPTSGFGLIPDGLSITIVPEPASCALAIAGVCLLGHRQRRTSARI